MKHKHADLIHQWADGAEIQRFSLTQDCWVDDRPDWFENTEYRIKPEEKKPVVRWLWAYTDGDKVYVAHEVMTEQFAKDHLNNPIKLEWSRTEFPE